MILRQNQVDEEANPNSMQKYSIRQKAFLWSSVKIRSICRVNNTTNLRIDVTPDAHS